jgi:hypothetical protein
MVRVMDIVGSKLIGGGLCEGRKEHRLRGKDALGGNRDIICRFVGRTPVGKQCSSSRVGCTACVVSLVAL